MSKRIRRFCDRCNEEIFDGRDDRVQDFIDDEYAPMDICRDCALSGHLVAEASKADVIRNLPPGTTLKRMMENYQ